MEFRRVLFRSYCPNKDIWGLEGLGIQTFSKMNSLPELLGVDRG
mgnify:CR=1 FL=1